MNVLRFLTETRVVLQVVPQAPLRHRGCLGMTENTP